MGQFNKSQKAFQFGLEIILRNHLMLKQFEKLINGNEEDRQRIESMTGEFRHEFFILEKVEKLSYILKEPYICFTHFRGLSSENAVLHHLKSAHNDDINADLMETRRAGNTDRAVQRAVALKDAEISLKDEKIGEWRTHHRTAHSNLCPFDLT